CYEKLLLHDIERSHDPARELPRLDAETRAAGGFIAGACHPLMHQVGREYARRHHVTLGTLQKYLPKSNDPGCSAGFGHGLIMALGPQILKVGPKGALRVCTALATRMRQYTCIHGLGHAYMRMYGEYLRYALPLCRKLGADAAPDCAQGAFHDYWIASSGRDATAKRPGLITSPRVLCGAQKGTFAMACWYRVYVERPPKNSVETAGDIEALCRGLRNVQRAGCVAAAALSAAGSDPFALTTLCAHLHGNDVANCLRADPVEEVGPWRSRQLQLIRTCGALADGTRRACYEWLGKALAVVTDGRFMRSCGQLRSAAARTQCRIGARRYEDPLVTFA
ncbi:MAG TPA: hypothetical protein VFR50_06795, partial [Casimicrobiaceae bacterium]|nr:hypothetical protein [Casimicrobiaceae bacterium]